MRKALILFLFLGYALHAQDVRFTASVYAEPQHYSENIYDKADGFNIGAQIEYQMTITYVDAEIFYFPKLNGVDYAHIQGTLFGLNFHNRMKTQRIYAGLLKIGLISREWKYHYPMVGLDVGIEQYIGDRFYVGIQAGWDYCTDDKYWGVADPGFWRTNAGIRLGYVFGQAPLSLWKGRCK
jgi:hypothetical protein